MVKWVMGELGCVRMWGVIPGGRVRQRSSDMFRNEMESCIEGWR